MISAEALSAWKAHAINCKGEEAVGIIVQGQFKPLKNVAIDKENEFRTDPKEIVNLLPDGCDVEAVLHSHMPKHPTGPSKHDMEQQMMAGVPFGISKCDGENCSDPLWFGDQVPMKPLVGRPFIYGLYDCFSLTRDFYRQHGVNYDDFPREPLWWNEPGKDYYMDMLETAGFRIISYSEVRPGDGFLMSLLSKTGVCNHSGVYVGNDLLLHHLNGRRSGTDIMGRWREKVRHWVRHKDMTSEVIHVA